MLPYVGIEDCIVSPSNSPCDIICYPIATQDATILYLKSIVHYDMFKYLTHHLPRIKPM